MTKSATTLDDKYIQSGGRVFISSNQALVRLPLDQKRRDRAAGLNTAGYISGYRGSPLGVYDSTLWAAQKLLDSHDIRFKPGLNEELAVSAIRGTQQLKWFGKSNFDGVFGLWYGKGVGVDRACESLKLGNLEGSVRARRLSRRGGRRSRRQVLRQRASIRAHADRRPAADSVSGDDQRDHRIRFVRLGDVALQRLLRRPQMHHRHARSVGLAWSLPIPIARSRSPPTTLCRPAA